MCEYGVIAKRRSEAERFRRARLFRRPVLRSLLCSVTHVVREGNKPYREIASYASEKDIDLICIGAHGKGFQFGPLFGSNADRLLRESPCPVLVVRPLELAGE